MALAIMRASSSPAAPGEVRLRRARRGADDQAERDEVALTHLRGKPHRDLADHAESARRESTAGVPGEELVWIEDKILQFKIPDLPPGEYVVTIHDDKGPPDDLIYSFLETTAYVIFPPVWPFVFRSNQTQFTLRVLPHN